jgi:hypothetical protein
LLPFKGGSSRLAYDAPSVPKLESDVRGKLSAPFIGDKVHDELEHYLDLVPNDHRSTILQAMLGSQAAPVMVLRGASVATAEASALAKSRGAIEGVADPGAYVAEVESRGIYGSASVERSKSWEEFCNKGHRFEWAVNGGEHVIGSAHQLRVAMCSTRRVDVTSQEGGNFCHYINLAAESLSGHTAVGGTLAFEKVCTQEELDAVIGSYTAINTGQQYRCRRGTCRFAQLAVVPTPGLLMSGPRLTSAGIKAVAQFRELAQYFEDPADSFRAMNAAGDFSVCMNEEQANAWLKTLPGCKQSRSGPGTWYSTTIVGLAKGHRRTPHPFTVIGGKSANGGNAALQLIAK